MLEKYLRNIFITQNQGDAREESFYPALVDLLNEFSESIGDKKVHITTLPKKTDAGNPDLRIWDGKQHIVGYIEAKHPSTTHLESIEDSQQLDRYRKTFPNLILTNFFEFRLYREGEIIDTVQIGRPFIAQKLRMIPPAEKQEEFYLLLKKYFSYSLPQVYNAKQLAIELAKRTRFLKEEVIELELYEEEKSGKGFILGFYNAFKQYLIGRLSREEFADLYAQTITYGLFAARSRSTNSFNRKLAYDYIPNTIGILRDVFNFISLGQLPQQMEWIVDDIAEVLAITDVNNILHQYFHQDKGKDPIVHFYETFLAEYDPQTRERRGVYYTPEPAVSYIIRSLHEILKKYFKCTDGLASDSVTLLDPAGGTLTFMAWAAKLAVEEFVAKYGEGGREHFIREHILKNFYAFELMMAPYAVGHLKMSFLLEELGYTMTKNERFKLYLTNTLEMEELAQSNFPGMSSLSEESHLAGIVKKKQPILVILGNPPYSGISTNVGEWITRLIEDYKYVDGNHFGERKHWLQDDYVKFIRFAQWKIDQAGKGVIGFITNHSYLDNPTFRGMRQSLMKSFDEIYILDLHGNSLKKERAPDGSKDENVFDIRQGVAIALFIKKNAAKKNCKVYHAELWGSREEKYQWLSTHKSKSTNWNVLNPEKPFYFFITRKEKGKKNYEKFWSVNEIFPVHVTGIVTARDGFVIDFDKAILKRRIEMFRNLSMSDELIRKTFRLKDTRGWKLPEARKVLAADINWEKYFSRILYRPFDIRSIYYSEKMVDWGRQEMMNHMLEKNHALVMPKRVETKIPWAHAFCTNNMADHVAVSLKTIDYLFPIYIYSSQAPSPKKTSSNIMMLFEDKTSYRVKKPNLSYKLLIALDKHYKVTPNPESIFNYIYAILYAPTYRQKYSEFLKIDFPRIPFTTSYRIFKAMAEQGEMLVNLHLLESKMLNIPIARFQGKGDNVVEKLNYDAVNQRVFINEKQYFEGVLNEVWEYQIGGYQVCNKWLKDRKHKKLSLDEIKHYCHVVTSLKNTMDVQAAIDKLYPQVEKRVIEFLNE